MVRHCENAALADAKNKTVGAGRENEKIVVSFRSCIAPVLVSVKYNYVLTNYFFLAGELGFLPAHSQ